MFSTLSTYNDQKCFIKKSQINFFRNGNVLHTISSLHVVSKLIPKEMKWTLMYFWYVGLVNFTRFSREWFIIHLDFYFQRSRGTTASLCLKMAPCTRSTWSGKSVRERTRVRQRTTRSASTNWWSRPRSWQDRGRSERLWRKIKQLWRSVTARN